MKNVVDKFLDYLRTNGDDPVQYERVVVKPTKTQATVGFVVSLLVFISCLLLLLGSIVGYVVTIIAFIF